jgi:hypothetical protein
MFIVHILLTRHNFFQISDKTTVCKSQATIYNRITEADAIRHSTSKE